MRGRRAGQARRVPRRSARKWDVARHRHRRGRRQRPARPSSGTARPSSTCRRAPSRTRARSTSGRSPGRPGRTRCRPTDRTTLPRPATGDELRATLLQLVAAPNLASKSWVTDQYDRYVMGNTVLAQPEDAGVIRVDEATGLGVALATDGNGRYAKLDPYAGAQLALAEAYRNVAVSGAKPLAVTDCLNFGSPEDPDVMWQFAEATRGLADACLELGVPVTGGNVSFYNQTGDVGDPPDAGGRRARRDRRRAPADADGLRRRGRGRAAARRRRATSSAARSGRTSCTATSAACRRRSTSPPRRRSAALLAAAADEALVDRRARRVRRRAGADAGRDGAAPRGRRDRVAGRGGRTRSSRCSASRSPGPSWPCPQTGPQTSRPAPRRTACR